MSRKKATIALLSAAAAVWVFHDRAGEVFAEAFTLTPSLSLEERYDSNARLEGSEESEREDLVTTARPQINLKRDKERYGLEGLYRLEANYYSLNPELNNIEHRAEVNAEADVTKSFFIGAGDRYDFTKDSLRASASSILVTRTDIAANTAYVTFGHVHSERTRYELTLKDAILDFEEPSLVDSRTDSATLSGYHKYSKSGAARLSYAFTNYHFRSDGENDINSHSVSAGVTEEINQGVKVKISGGAEYVPDLNGGEYFMLAGAGLEKTYKDSSLSIAYTREVTAPNGLADELNVSDRVDFEYNHAITKELSASVTGGVAKNRTEPSGAVDLNSYAAALTGIWRPYQWMQLGGGLSHYQQWPEDSFGDGLRRNIIFLNVTFTGKNWRF